MSDKKDPGWMRGYDECILEKYGRRCSDDWDNYRCRSGIGSCSDMPTTAPIRGIRNRQVAVV